MVWQWVLGDPSGEALEYDKFKKDERIRKVTVMRDGGCNGVLLIFVRLRVDT